MTDIKIKIDVAREFGSRIQEVMTVQQFRMITELNKSEAYQSVCHSHDFCDANMHMAEAFGLIVGHEPEGDNEADAEIWNDAWDIAKAAEFFA